MTSDDLIAEARESAGPDNGGWKPFDQNERIRHWGSPFVADIPGYGDEYYLDVLAWEEAHGHDVRLKCYPVLCQVVESYLKWLISRLADALESAESRATKAEADRDEFKRLHLDGVQRAHVAEKELRDRELHHFEVEQELAAALAVIEKARGMFQNDGFHESPLGRLLSSVPADVLRERDAEKWDEGARWAAVECAAIDDERQAWIAPGDNPYRIKEENNDN